MSSADSRNVIPSLFFSHAPIERRYATLPNIMKAKKKKIDAMNLEELGLDIEPRLEVESVSEPPERKGGIKVESVDELLEKLKNEAGVL